MSKYLIPAALLFGLIAVAGGCKKSKSAAATAVPSYNMTAIIIKAGDTTVFTASGATYVTAVDSNNTCTIRAADTSRNAVIANLTFTINYYHGIFTYALNIDGTGNYETVNPAFAQTAFSGGPLAIDTISGETISGTFSGVLTDGSVVSNGTFTALGSGF